MKKQILLTCILLSGVLFAQAQTATVASGGEAEGIGGTASYSIGQVAYKSPSRGRARVTEGVQQSYEISTVTGIEETAISLNILAYPNPTVDYLILKVDAEQSRNMEFQLFDMQSNILQGEKLRGPETQIDMSVHLPAAYILRVILEDKPIKTFKIIKQ